MKKNQPETIEQHFAAFIRGVERLLGGRCCDCELPGVEVIVERARGDFTAALPHLEQMERGATRAELGELQLALIDKAQRSLFAVAIAIANELGMSLTEPERLDDGRATAFEMLSRLSPFLDDEDARAQLAFTSPSSTCDGENAEDHAS
ncbi:MAG: hypothetical protein ABI678_19990 [Kofleriaceae bacterium]